jgi:hypothetical protein
MYDPADVRLLCYNGLCLQQEKSLPSPLLTSEILQDVSSVDAIALCQGITSSSIGDRFSVAKRLLVTDSFTFRSELSYAQYLIRGHLKVFMLPGSLKNDCLITCLRAVSTCDLTCDSVLCWHVTHSYKAFSCVVVLMQAPNRRSNRSSKRTWTRPLKAQPTGIKFEYILLFSLLLCTHLQFTHLHLVQYKLSSKSSIWQPFLRDSSLLRERFGHRVYVRSKKCRYVVRGGKGKRCDLCGLLEEGKQESRFGQILRLVKCYSSSVGALSSQV